MKKSFKYWKREDLYREIGLSVQPNMAILSNWLSTTEAVDATEAIFLDKLCRKAEPFIDGWNEAELQIKFIAKVLDLVDFDLPDYRCNSFSERYISASVQHLTLYGFADWMVAEGETEPTHPYFFMHEYKPEGEKQIDGRGQLLAVMLATQALNKDNYPIYGCFVHGRMWFFVVLKDLKYEISRAYIATQLNDLQEIVKILKQQKKMILERIKK
jgi:hypothetical protein